LAFLSTLSGSDPLVNLKIVRGFLNGFGVLEEGCLDLETSLFPAIGELLYLIWFFNPQKPDFDKFWGELVIVLSKIKAQIYSHLLKCNETGMLQNLPM